MATATYKRFLALPDASLLASPAGICYVTTGTTISGAADEIVKHLLGLRSQLKKKRQDFLTAIEDRTGTQLAVEVDTEIEFLSTAGPYLPGMDDNFLADRVVQFLILHIVTFDAAGKIAQIRVSWDQGALLKQLDVIGKTGRNWPIHDSREQIKTVASCNRAAPPITAANGSKSNGGDAATDHGNRASRSNSSAPPYLPEEYPERVVSPYAGSRPQQRSFTDILGDQPNAGPTAVVSPYAGARPSQRSFEVIIGEEDEDESENADVDPQSPSAGRGRSMSSMSKTFAPRAGAGKNFQPSRVFEGAEHPESDEDGETTPEKNAKRFYRPDPTKYDHFDFIDGSDPLDAPKPGVPLDNKPRSRHDSSWSFDDFVTPHRPKPSKAFHHQDVRQQDVRHWDTEFENVQETPGQRAPPVKPRRDAETHYEMQDDGSRPEGAAASYAGKSRGAVHNERLHLYDAKLSRAAAQDGSSLAPATPDANCVPGKVANLKDRRNDFDPHFAMADKSPLNKENHREGGGGGGGNRRNGNISDKSTGPIPNERGININGDGMGGRKGTDRDWMCGGQSEQERIVSIAGEDGVGGRKGYDRSRTTSGRSEKEGINISGDGMGGRKGSDRSWLYGEEAAADQNSAVAAGVPGKKLGGAAATKNLSRDF